MPFSDYIVYVDENGDHGLANIDNTFNAIEVAIGNPSGNWKSRTPCSRPRSSLQLINLSYRIFPRAIGLEGLGSMVKKKAKGKHDPWNKGREVGQRAPLSLPEVTRIKKLLAKRAMPV